MSDVVNLGPLTDEEPGILEKSARPTAKDGASREIEAADVAFSASGHLVLRLIAEVRRQRTRLDSARAAMSQALDALESDGEDARRAAFERMQDEFDGVPAEKPSNEVDR